MTEREKLALLEDMMELEEGDLTADMVLADIDEFDSMARLSLIVLFEDEFEKKISGQDIKKYVTIQDILNAMEN
jgi:acyl carrier protein